MQWWAWIAVGAILLGAELTVVNAQFYLVFLGAAALIVGACSLAGLLPAEWLQWLTFSALALASMVLFRQRVYERMRRRLPSMSAGPEGEMVTLDAPLQPGETGRIEYRGGSWEVVNCGASAIPAGGRARVMRVDRLTLMVQVDE
jgi:hypothetical protein